MRIKRGLPYCPYCGEEKRFSCRCGYGKIMKLRMDPNEKEMGFYHKRFCPKCGNKTTADTCKECGLTFSESDFWMKTLW